MRHLIYRGLVYRYASVGERQPWILMFWDGPAGCWKESVYKWSWVLSNCEKVITAEEAGILIKGA